MYVTSASNTSLMRKLICCFRKFPRNALGIIIAIAWSEQGKKTHCFHRLVIWSRLAEPSVHIHAILVFVFAFLDSCLEGGLDVCAHGGQVLESLPKYHTCGFSCTGGRVDTEWCEKVLWATYP